MNPLVFHQSQHHSFVGLLNYFYLLLIFIYLFIYWLCHVLISAHWIFDLSCGMQDLAPWQEMEPMPPALGAQSLSHWTTREVPPWLCFILWHPWILWFLTGWFLTHNISQVQAHLHCNTSLPSLSWFTSTSFTIFEEGVTKQLLFLPHHFPYKPYSLLSCTAHSLE